MNDIRYTLVFDLLREGFPVWHPIVYGPGAMCLLITIVLVRFRHLLGDEDDERTPLKVLTGILGAVFSGCIAIGMVYYTRREFLELSRALGEHRVLVTEGKVVALVAQPASGRPGEETFRVGDASFAYSAQRYTSAFHRTVGQGGPMREGLPVRIWSVDGMIVRLEIGAITAGR